jgi:hypothetical protein
MPWLVLLAALAQIVFAYVPSGLGYGASVAARSAPVTTPATPAGWAFAIWGLIYLACAVFAVWQALPAQRRKGLVVEVRGPAALLFTANTAWSLYVQLAAIDVVSVAIILVGLAAGLTAVKRMQRFATPAGSADAWLVKAPLSLAAGWVSVAVFANIAAALSGRKLDPGHIGGAATAAILVALAGLVGAWVTRQWRANIAYPAAVLWGLVAIAAANRAPGGQELVMAVALAAALLVVLAAVFRKRALAKT